MTCRKEPVLQSRTLHIPLPQNYIIYFELICRHDLPDSIYCLAPSFANIRFSKCREQSDKGIAMAR